MAHASNPTWVVKPFVPDEVYTDREEFLDYFYNAALAAARRRTMSTVLLGQRRMGKTEIFKRVVNRLFFEQDPSASDAVVPVYFSFPDGKMDERRFGKEYMENFLRYYVGFYARLPGLVRDEPKGNSLLRMVEEYSGLFPFTDRLQLIMNWLKAVETGDSSMPHWDALKLPRRVSDTDDSTIVMFLDEFQNTRLPQYMFDIAGFMQEAVESPTCPHFVTGSAMSILSREIIGRGSLFGRFDGMDIEAMTQYYGAVLAQKAANYYGVEISVLMAPVVADRCGGNPFYITAVLRQAAKSRCPVSDEKALDKIMAVDITSGFIWGELNDQVARWIERINEHNITKWILYLSALEENEEKEKRNRLNVERIQRELKKREGSDVPLETIRDTLIKLSRGDLLEYLELGDWFRRVKDPILLEFLKVWGKIEVEGLAKTAVQDKLKEKYQKINKRTLNEYKGYLAEIHMSQILLSGQETAFPGRLFNSTKDVRLPSFTYVHHRVRLSSGINREIDVLGAAGVEKWVCQSKWVKGGRIGIKILRDLTSLATMVNKEMTPEILRVWLFADRGLTPDAKAYAKEHGTLWSSRAEFDELSTRLGLRVLPEI